MLSAFTVVPRCSPLDLVRLWCEALWLLLAVDHLQAYVSARSFWLGLPMGLVERRASSPLACALPLVATPEGSTSVS